MTTPAEFGATLGSQLAALESRYAILQGPRGNPAAEVYHSFQNFLVELDVPASADNDAMIRHLRQMAGNWDMCQMRMEAWEDQVDFDALGISEKPSEAGQKLIGEIHQFLTQLPRVSHGERGTSQEQLAAFVMEMEAPYLDAAQRLRPLCTGRDNPVDELLHIYGNVMPYTITETVQDAVTLSQMTKAGAAERAERVNESVFRKLRQFTEAVELSTMRMTPWENKIDFNALGWEGPKPTEILAQCEIAIKEFLETNPQLEAELTGKGGSRSIV